MVMMSVAFIPLEIDMVSETLVEVFVLSMSKARFSLLQLLQPAKTGLRPKPREPQPGCRLGLVFPQQLCTTSSSCSIGTPHWIPRRLAVAGPFTRIVGAARRVAAVDKQVLGQGT